MPGGFFVLHTAYGRSGDIDVGGVEIIGYDAASQTYRTHFFDSQGHISSQELVASGDTWKWTGDWWSKIGRSFHATGRAM